ncbi:MAG: hypothetical protein EWV88_12165 [Microcystis wesenbergii Mw_MB_S_20031200_S109D]|uniref:Enoyl reductase (ER) domain-containing protein n=1 Tax=Microcystis wesenbergii Mw_MB_S_20031200_S109D TaxID=2486241 RepID=A0A552LSK0_9CHRO|nr:MAG: hypothetical protein EWV88_12165 [Microcystis wesenbergii Mw_MB_S_20031200_S109D]
MTDIAGRIAKLPLKDRAKLLSDLQRDRPTVPTRGTVSHPSDWPNAKIGLKQSANLDDLGFEEMALQPPGPGQIQVRARAISINFRDLMIAMALYPPTPGVPSVMGSDYAGEVIACGSGVEEFSPGDRVMVLSAGDTATDGRLLEGSHFCAVPNVWAFQAVPIPPNLNFIEAASIPTAFLTAFYGLESVARVQGGERVLIHTATGGVGLAAIEIAQARGAEIMATAGSEAKRDYLRQRGILQVFDSRSLAFADQISGGVDIILNTLSGEAVAHGLGLMRPFGRFLQIAMKDQALGETLPMSAFRLGVSFTTINLSLFLFNPSMLKRIFKELADGLATGIWRPTPITTFPPEKIGAALRLMSQYRHIGKIVIDLEARA